MKIEVTDADPTQVSADVLIFGVSDPPELSPLAQQLDARVGGELAKMISERELKGSVGSLAILRTRGDLEATRVGAVGLGKSTKLDLDAIRTAAAKAADRTAELGGNTLAWMLDAESSEFAAAEVAGAVAEGASIAAYDPGRWKSPNDERKRPIERLVLCGRSDETVAEQTRHTEVIARWINVCRDLVNAPANELTPEALAEFARQTTAEIDDLEVNVLGPEEIRAEGMGAFIAVSQASHNPPRLITLAYEPADARQPDVRLGLVGKAITFDSGGLSLKPSARMDEMKADMGGGAAALAGTAAVAALGLPVRILTVVPACENMPSGHAYRPGDILKAANGKTIEITNTDAEGRLILADALWHARESGATHILDFATLTGAIVVAIGDYYAGLFGNDGEWVETIGEAAEASGDHAWPMPLHDTYVRHYRSWFADMKNSSDLRQAGPVYAARFLQEFAGEGPWAHLDIAGTAFLERGRGDYYSGRGATGYGVRLIAELARRLST